MKNIVIKDLILSNFGGISYAKYSFNEKVNQIYGASGTGKTSFYNAYMFVLGFNVTNWESLIDGNKIYKAKTEVELNLLVDGLEYNFKKTNTQKYKTENDTIKFVGNNFEYFIDGQKTTFSDYKEQICKIYETDYKTLELLTSVDLFNGESNDWDKIQRRKFLFNLFNLDTKLKDLQSKFLYLKNYFLKGYDEIQIKDILNKQKTQIERELNSNNAIIEERNRDIADYSGINFTELENQKIENEEKIKLLKTENNDNVKNNLIIEKNNMLLNLQTQLSEIKLKNNKLLSDYSVKQENIKQEINTYNYYIKTKTESINKYNDNLITFDIDMAELNDIDFNESDKYCKTCGQELPPDKIKLLVDNFNNQKAKKLCKLQDDKNSVIKNIELYNDQINSYKTKISQLELELNTPQPEITDTSELVANIDTLKTEIESLKVDNIDTQKNEQIKILLAELQEINKKISYKTILENSRNRVAELMARNIELVNQEKDRLLMKEELKSYSKEKVGLITDCINTHFEKVSYDFFRYQGANAQNPYEDICSVTMDSVEYKSMSSGQRVKANYYTLKSLRNILNLNIPQFIDDVVLSDMLPEDNNWQTIYLITDNSKKLDNTLIKDIFTKEHCFKAENGGVI